ncbi:hypothetical protein BTUL_0122g00160 [Botrytis tulipae]|uniref:Uncharacterized protein n=1 Tax=Botrytis tulipae TaxID=87230 RepID=A0A4Z1EFC3_9HELO|nr:hypothetical protein BTUL_0122g00160 [Botrytis tulipae]
MSSNLTTEDPIILAVPPLDLGNREVGASIQYIDFFLNVPEEAREILADYKKAVWWNTAYASDSVPQDESVTSAAKRVGYSARVADYDIKNTPWLSSAKSEIKKKSISVSSKNFHGALTDTVLEGSVSLPASGSEDLENFFKVLTEAVETRSQFCSDTNIHHMQELFVHQLLYQSIQTVIRTCLFEVTSEMVEVQRKKSSSTTINVPIAYSEYEAVVNMDFWTQASDMIEEQEKIQREDYVKNDTIKISA